MSRQISPREVADYMLGLIELGSGAAPEPEDRLLTEKLATVIRLLGVPAFQAKLEDDRFQAGFAVLSTTFHGNEAKAMADLEALCNTIGYKYRLHNYVLTVSRDLKTDPVAEAVASESAADVIEAARRAAGIAKPVKAQATNKAKRGYTKDELIHLAKLTLLAGAGVFTVVSLIRGFKR